MRILIIQTGLTGDVIFSTPVIRALRNHFKEAEIDVITTASPREVLQAYALVDRIYVKESWFTILKEHSGKRYNFIFDLSPGLGSRALGMLLGGKLLRLPRRNYIRSRFASRRSMENHQVDQYQVLLESIGVEISDAQLQFPIPDKYEVPVEWLPEGYDEGYAVFCIGAEFETRRLPRYRMIELCDKINKPIVLVGGKEFAEDGAAIERFFQRAHDGNDFEAGLAELNKKAIVYNGCGKFNLFQQASLVRQAKYVFTFDNEFIAIASAFAKHVVCILGNTTAMSGAYPYQTQFTLLENTRLSCRPCSAKGFKRCPLGHFKCMNEITFDFYLQ